MLYEIFIAVGASFVSFIILLLVFKLFQLQRWCWECCARCRIRRRVQNDQVLQAMVNANENGGVGGGSGSIVTANEYFYHNRIGGLESNGAGGNGLSDLALTPQEIRFVFGLDTAQPTQS
jgi:hypothetical protein